MSLRLRRTATPLVAAGLTLILAGCGANFEAQTYQERSSADGTNGAVGAIAVRNVTVTAPGAADALQAGSDVEVRLTLTNDGGEDDRLVEVTSPAASSVEVLVDGEPVEDVDLPRLGTTGDDLTLQLVDLNEDLRPGRYVDITLRFQDNGEITISAPVATTGEFEEREPSENFHQIDEEEH